MRTLINGIKVPEDDDAGNVWSNALEYDMEQLDGLIESVNNLNTSDISKLSTNLFSANWDVDADGKGYKQTVVMPSGLSLDNLNLRFRITSGPLIQNFINPTVKPLSLTSFEVIVNDNSLDLEILYV